MARHCLSSSNRGADTTTRGHRERNHHITGGADTHKDNHVAAALDPLGGILGTETFPATRKGYTALLAWLRSFGTIVAVGVEGAGSRGAGLARFLAIAEITVLEINRPDRQARRRHGKNDTVDAIAAALAVLSGDATSIPKSAGGNVESIRLLRVARRSAVHARTQAVNQFRSIVDTAPDELSAELSASHGRSRFAKAGRFRAGEHVASGGSEDRVVRDCPKVDRARRGNPCVGRAPSEAGQGDSASVGRTPRCRPGHRRCGVGCCW